MITTELKKDISSWINTLLANSTNLVIGLATGVILARTLGPEGRGELASILIWPNLLAPIGLMGLHEAIVYSLGAKKEEFRLLLSNSMLLVALLSVVVIGVGFLLIPFVIGEERHTFLPLINMYLVVFVPLYYLSLTLLAFEQGRLRFKKYNLFQLVPPVLYFVALMILWGTGEMSVTSALWSSVFGVAVSALVLLFFIRDDIQKTPSVKKSIALIKQGAKFHSPTVITLISMQMDKLVVIKFMDNVSMGFYVVAYTFASAALNAVSHAAHTVMFPRISRERDAEKRKRYLFQGIGLSAIIMVLVSMVFIASANWLLPMLFGVMYTGVISLAGVLIVACVPLYIRQITIRSFKGMGVSRYSLISEVMSLVAFSLVVVPLLKAFSLTGVGYALIISNTISLFFLLWVGKNRLFMKAS